MANKPMGSALSYSDYVEDVLVSAKDIVEYTAWWLEDQQELQFQHRFRNYNKFDEIHEEIHGLDVFYGPDLLEELLDELYDD